MPTRWRCGSPATTRQSIAACTPAGQQARAVFDAVEQARVEAIGARRMDGVAEQPRRDARGPLPPRQLRRDHRPRRRAARGRAGADGARAADRHGAAAGGARSSSISGATGSRTAPARDLDRLDGPGRGPAPFRATPSTICSTRSTWATSRSRDDEEERRGGRGGSPQAGSERRRRGRRRGRDAAHEHGGQREASAEDMPDAASRGRRRADRRHGR